MCGILGALGPIELVAEGNLTAGLAVMVHRGPDGQGFQRIPLRGIPSRHLLLGHRRLSIIDLTENGAQPMTDLPTGNCIVYNGEIYNFRDIRSKLAAQGVTFRSTSDTEVLLAAYSHSGLLPCLAELAGMFAFAIWDNARQQLILVRDHTGIKPLYYYSSHGLFLFASEVRALLATGLVPPRLDPAALPGYLKFGSVQRTRTLVQDIRALGPAQYLVVNADGSFDAPKEYWHPDFRPESESIPPGKRLVKGLRELLEKVVSEHLISDVPLGAFLSGGLDSSSLVSLMAGVASTQMGTFSVTFREKASSEAYYSRQMARHARTKHEEIVLTESDFLAGMPAMLGAMDQPSVDGSNVYVISGAVRKAGMTVALSGQGADEVFGGYSSFSRLCQLDRMQPLLRHIPATWRQAAASAASALLPAHPKWAKLPDLMRSCSSLPASYAVIHAMGCSTLTNGLLAPAARNSWHDELSVPQMNHSPRRAVHPANLVSALELSNYLPNTLLRDGDVMSMAHSLEIRVPFLDRRVIDYVAPISGTAKLPGAYSKPLLVDAVKDLLPTEIYTRCKGGFIFPWGRWLKQSLRNPVGSVLDKSDCGVEIGFLPGACRNVWRAFLHDSRVPWTMVWGLYTLVTWCSRYGVVLDDVTAIESQALAQKGAPVLS